MIETEMLNDEIIIIPNIREICWNIKDIRSDEEIEKILATKMMKNKNNKKV